MRKMGPKGARKGPGRPAGLAHFGAQSVSDFFSTKYTSTLIYVLPKPPTNSAYKYPEAADKEGHLEGGIAESIAEETSFRDPFELDTRERRHRRLHRPSAPLQVGGQQGIHPLPEISSP